MRKYDLIVVPSAQGGRACVMNEGTHEKIAGISFVQFRETDYRTFANGAVAYRVSVRELEHWAIIRFIKANNLQEERNIS